MISEHVLVVGVDETAASVAAVRWAADEARLRHAAVRLVGSRHRDPRLHAPYAPGAASRDAEAEAAVQARLEAAAEIARDLLPPGYLTVELTDEPPARALLDRAAGADMLILGVPRPARQSDGEHPASLNPVAITCLRRAPCAVIVIASGK